MEEKLNKLTALMNEIADLAGAQAVLGWDQQTYMPPGGAESRGDQLSTLARITHDKFVSPEIGQLLEDLKPLAEQLDPDSDEARLIKVTTREYKKQTKVPSKLVSEFAQVTTVAQEAWLNARKTSDFSLFQPYLEKIVDLRKQYADCFKPYQHIYDPLLDDFEPGLKTAEVQDIFNILRPQQVELIKAISNRPQVDDRFLRTEYNEQRQWDFGIEVATRMGFDWKCGREDRTTHPFTTSFGIKDVRITTRFDPTRGASALFSTMHEGGHALYEQGISPKLGRTLLATGASMAIHESQSRLWENLVGRSKPFWRHFYPRFQNLFPAQLGNVNLETFYKGINKVEPSFIRVEADEATYNLHIMLRLELEIAMMEGRLAVSDLPEAWNARMQDYLGITPSNNTQGVLQDIHWAGGSIGYFPTYALGNLVSVQLWERITADNPNLEDQIAVGDFSSLLGWLREKVHVHGAKFDPQELMIKVTGQKITPQPYIRYLKTKFAEIYGL